MNLQNMAPSAKRSFAVTGVFGAIAAALYLFAIEPAETELKRIQKELGELEAQHEIIVRNLRGFAQVSNRLETVNAELKPFREALLEPFLESYAMGAKGAVGDFAAEAGLVDVEYEDLALLTLPVPKRLPEQLHGRLPVRISAHGSYQAAISFLLRVEKELPLVTLQSMNVSAEGDPGRQRVDFTFEWPVVGANTKPQKGAVRK